LYDTIIDIFHIKHSSSQKLSGNTMQATAAKPYRVLLVEDNQTNQFIARVILEQAGFTVATAANGREGCDYFAAHRDELDLILMDLHMPVMDGYTAADKIREKDDGIPIVAMTADAIAGVRENCAAHGLSSIPEKRRHEESSVSADVSGRVLNTKEGVKHIGGDTTLYKLILQTYLDEAVGIIAELKAALDADNIALARDLAHKLKSSTGSIGSDSVYRSAAALQAALEQAQADEVQTLYNDFSSLFSQLTDEIRAYLTANGPA
jgi:CheY-like chemotaxis protein